MKIVLTGALGHIGSRFIHSLEPGEFNKVILLDNLATQRYCSLFNLPDGVPFCFVEADVRSADLTQIFDGAHAVIHLAAITNAAASFENQKEVEQVNLTGTQRVAQACIETGSRLVFLSTTSVYGTQEDEVDEFCSTEQLNPQSPYAESKLKSEDMLARMHVESGLRFVVCRMGTIYGTSPGMRFHTAINKFVWQACAGLPVTVWRTALHQKRPYLELGDAVDAIKFIVQNDLFDGSVYNILTENLSVNEILDPLRTLIPDLHVDFVDMRIMNQLSYRVLNDRFRRLGFIFQGSLDVGLRQTVEKIRKIRSAG